MRPSCGPGESVVTQGAVRREFIARRQDDGIGIIRTRGIATGKAAGELDGLAAPTLPPPRSGSDDSGRYGSSYTSTSAMPVVPPTPLTWAV